MLRRLALFRRFIAFAAILVMAAGVMAVGRAEAHQLRTAHVSTPIVLSAGDEDAVLPPCHGAKAKPVQMEKSALCLALCGAASRDHFRGDVSFSSIAPVKAKAVYVSPAFVVPPVGIVIVGPEMRPPLPSGRLRPVYLQTQRLLI